MTAPKLTLFNSLTRALEPFVPVHDGEARVYSCGPTVYNYPHIGNMRAYVFADTLGRALEWQGYKLTHIVNITDVGHLTDDGDAGEDKLELAAAKSEQSIWDIARHYTDAFKSDVRALNIREPSQWSVATDYIDPMIEFAKGIADKHCYELDSGLYFDVSTVEDYGRLAGGTKLDQLQEDSEAHMRIDPVKDKRNSADFAIWRKTPAGETRQMEWDSPWGKGAPGWHLECSVMGEKLLGFPFDIHTGGIDHREIHHPNEIAQNQAFCGCGGLDEPAHSGARIWMHNNFLIARKDEGSSGKMSKSSGEFLRLQLLIDRGYHPLAYRMMCLQAHYRSELEFSWEGLGAALTRLKRLVMQVDKLKAELAAGKQPEGSFPLSAQERAMFDEAICGDLNTAVVLTQLETLLSAKKTPAAKRIQGVRIADQLLGLGLLELTREDLRLNPVAAEIDEAGIAALIARRQQARADKDFSASDAIRDELAAKRVEVMDGDSLGWEWKLD